MLYHLGRISLRKNTMEKVLTRHKKTFHPGLGTSCKEWSGVRAPKGYGLVSYLGKLRRVHRLSYSHYVGEIPDGMFVLHKCDNPPCFEPTHLFLGTNQDNVNDKVSKNRQSRSKGSAGGR